MAIQIPIKCLNIHYLKSNLYSKKNKKLVLNNYDRLNFNNKTMFHSFEVNQTRSLVE